MTECTPRSGQRHADGTCPDEGVGVEQQTADGRNYSAQCAGIRKNNTAACAARAADGLTAKEIGRDRMAARPFCCTAFLPNCVL